MSDYWIFSGGFDLYAGLKEAAIATACCALLAVTVGICWDKFALAGRGEQGANNAD